ncbi:MAG TPA: MFS transporter [Gemmatimonadaceae bacterium]|nr:MFS transporter [Gemmatimonadaceae bacterium]
MARKLSRNVVALGGVSFLTDVATEMIYPLLPLFLSSVLGANASFIGAIEGAAESTAALLKLASGWWSDKLSKRKPLVVIGYGIATIARPFTAIAQTATQVLAIRLTDRVGKGIRTSPRDALLADSTDEESRGRAFGFHAAMDNAGAVLGPLIAFALLHEFNFSLRHMFWLAAIPGALAFIVLVVAVKEVEHRGPAAKAGSKPHLSMHEHLGRRFWLYLGVVFLFTLGNSTDAFLLLRSNQLGVAVALAPILWAFFNGIKAALGTWGGGLSDRIGRKPLIVAGWLVYALVYFAFARATQAWHAWALFAGYALFYALTEGTEKALVADLVPAARRGAAFGWFNLAVGLGALPASIIFGAIWDRAGSPVAFMFGASLALLAAIGMAIVAPGRKAAVS